MRDDDNGYLKFQGKRFRAPNEIALLLELIFSRRFAKFIVIDHEKAEPVWFFSFRATRRNANS